jgi:hypothetical protein
MLDVDQVRSLRRLAAPELSAYLDTNLATRRNQGHPPGYLAWLSCPRCGGERRAAAVRILLSELARRKAVSIDIVAGPAANRLRQTDGIAARLH